MNTYQDKYQKNLYTHIVFILQKTIDKWKIFLKSQQNKISSLYRKEDKNYRRLIMKNNANNKRVK